MRLFPSTRLMGGFTLIELSIVLVIIGLIVGGVLVGQDLINAAGIRATISQIEKYNAAANTFRGKYGYLPGDIPNPVAGQYGFSAGTGAGQGDGNGVLEGKFTGGQGALCGEPQMFWPDLSFANMVDGGFSNNQIACGSFTLTQLQIIGYLPTAKIGQGSYIYVWSGGWGLLAMHNFGTPNDRTNYFGLSGVIGTSGIPGYGGEPFATPSLTVQQAYNIDSKMDDGLPQTGRVLALYPGMENTGYGGWAAGGATDPTYGTNAWGDYSNTNGGPVTSAGDFGDGTAASANSCFDGSSGLPEKYSMGQSRGSGMNCALSFKFQ